MSAINKGNTLPINRGVELVLKRREPAKKAFTICFERMVSLFHRDITIYFNFSLRIGKPK